MPFFAPNHAIVEAYEYDGTPQCANKIIKWANPQITRPGISVQFADSKFFVLYLDRDWLRPDIREISKGDYITIRTGGIVILRREDIEENYTLIPLLDW